MEELFNSAQFSSKNDDALRDFELENVSSKKKALKRTQPKLDPAWDDGSAFPEVSSKNIFFSQGETLKAIEERPFKIGDRLEIVAHKKYSGEKGYLSGYHTNDRQQFWVKLDNYDLQIRVFPNQVKSSEEKEAIAQCQDSHNLTSAQGLAQDSPLQLQNLEDSSLLESQKSMITAVASCQNGSPVSATTVTCEVSQCEISENSGEKSTLLQLRHHVSPSQSRESDKEKKTPATVSPQSNEPLNLSDPNSSALKTCQDCSIAHLDQGGQHSIFSTSYARLPDSAMMLNGCVSLQEPLEVPLLEKDCSWLESPGALSNGKGRPPGLTKQEAGLKNLGAIKSGQVVNPEFLESSYALPLGWTDPQEERSALELLAEMELCAIAALPSETPLTGELPPLDLAESSTSTQLLSTQEIIEALSISEDELDEFWNNEPALFKGFKIQWLGATIQKWRVESNTFLKDKFPQSESIPEKFLEDKKQSPSTESLSLSPIESNTTPEIFLEESTADTKQLPSQKRRQRKGCLYKYLENKKLKNGNIASYPRVIGETRDPDNPKHWRWGFNWEEKIDGEWKGRSIGSVPLGAIALIQSMQKSGVPLEEIIGFIRRSKNKG